MKSFSTSSTNTNTKGHLQQSFFSENKRSETQSEQSSGEDLVEAVSWTTHYPMSRNGAVNTTPWLQVVGRFLSLLAL